MYKYNSNNAAKILLFLKIQIFRLLWVHFKLSQTWQRKGLQPIAQGNADNALRY
jgi:hypothetical protein